MCKMFLKCGIHKIFLQIVVHLLLIRSAEPVTGPTHGKVVVCYVASWSIYEKDGLKYQVEHLDPNLCTHVVYVFSILDEATNSIKPSDANADLDQVYSPGGYRRWTDLKQHYPHLKVSLGVGGWNDGWNKWSNVAANPVLRKQFAGYVLAYLQRYNFDGIDLNFEPPPLREDMGDHNANFVSLVRDIRQKFEPAGMLVNVGVNPLSDVINKAYDLQSLAEYVDYFHIKCFDYGGSWSRKVTVTSPLRSTSGYDVEQTIDLILSKGISPNKIVMGIPFLGRYFRTPLAGNFGDASDAPIGDDSTYYSKICRQISKKDSGVTVTWHDEYAQSTAKYRDLAENRTIVVVFDGERSVVKKTRYAMKKGLAGIMAYTIDNDDFMGMCEPETDAFADFVGVSFTKLRLPPAKPRKHALLWRVNQAIDLTLDERDKSEYLVSLLKLHLELDGIDPQDRNVCYQTANTYLRMLQLLLDLHSSNVKLAKNGKS